MDRRIEEGGSLLFNVLLGRELSETRRVDACQGLTEQNHHSSSSFQDMDKLNELRSNSSLTLLACDVQASYLYVSDHYKQRGSKSTQRPRLIHTYTHTQTKPVTSSYSILNNSCERQISKQCALLP